MGWEGSEISVPDCVLLLRSIIVEREPIYRQQESTSGFAAGLFGIDAAQAERLSDDRIGRALDRLFDADRAALLTEVVLCVARRFGVRMQQLHNDSTSISLCGQYSGASGRSVRNRRAPAIVYGYLKVSRVVREVHTFKQERRGRPGPNTAYRKVTRKRYDRRRQGARLVVGRTSPGPAHLLLQHALPADGLHARLPR